MKIANQNIKIRYWQRSYYVLQDNDKFKKASKKALIVKNCGHEFKQVRMSIGLPVKWNIGEFNETVFGNKIHDWYSVAMKGSTDSFVNQILIEDGTYDRDPGAKYPF